MRRFASTLLLATLLWSALAIAGERYELAVDGLACPFCAYGIEKQLSRVDGVETVETDVRAGKVVVTLRDGATLDEERARTAVESAGFTLRSFEKAEAED